MTNSAITYNSALRKYLTIVSKQEALTEKGLLLFVEELKQQEYSNNTIRLYYYAVLNALKGMGIHVDSVNIPDIDEDSVNRHIYKIEDVALLINSAKELGGVYTKSMVFSTIYGLRRTEISKLSLTNIDINNKTVKIKAAKKGKTITHAIPDEVIDYIDNDIKFLSDSGMSRIFDKISNNAGLKIKHSGWHSIRRSLVTELLFNGVSQETVLGFMRWKTHTILDTYHIRNPREDLIIFANHPFLNMWK